MNEQQVEIGKLKDKLIYQKMDLKEREKERERKESSLKILASDLAERAIKAEQEMTRQMQSNFASNLDANALAHCNRLREFYGLQSVDLLDFNKLEILKGSLTDNSGYTFARPRVKEVATNPLTLGALVDGCAEEDFERDLPPGAYIIIGAPASGKTLLLNSFIKRLKNRKVSPLIIKEPVEAELRVRSIFPAISEEEITNYLTTALFEDSEIITIDSFRFLEAISKYPARAGGVTGGLGLYATDFDAYAADAGKRMFVILTITHDDARVKEEITKTMIGASAGVFYPYMPVDGKASRSLSGWYSLRYGDRSRKEFVVNIDTTITATRKVRQLDSRAADMIAGLSVEE